MNTRHPAKAVIFDLFGTLVYDRFASRHYETLMGYLAGRLGCSLGLMRERWNDTFRKRLTGFYASIADNLAAIAAEGGWTVSPATLERMQSYFHEFTLESMAPVPGAMETLAACRRRGMRVALMSDCSTAVPAIWQRTPFPALFDAVVFSCEAKVRKPDPLFYQRCLNLLGADAQDCVYVGDGGGNEIQGAQGQGLRAVLVPSLADPLETPRLLVPDWAGERLGSLLEILEILG